MQQYPFLQWKVFLHETARNSHCTLIWWKMFSSQKFSIVGNLSLSEIFFHFFCKKMFWDTDENFLGYRFELLGSFLLIFSWPFAFNSQSDKKKDNKAFQFQTAHCRVPCASWQPMLTHFLVDNLPCVTSYYPAISSIYNPLKFPTKKTKKNPLKFFP